MGMLTRGNSKLGKDIWTFSLPALSTCPGRSDKCSKVCYAARYQKRFPSVLQKYNDNVFAFNSEDMVREIVKTKAKTVRIHVAGDFYSPEYALEWVEVATSCPDVTFYAYTRSYAAGSPELTMAINILAARPNVTIWRSWDSSMGFEIQPQPPSYGFKWATITSPGEVHKHVGGDRNIITCPEMTGAAKSCSECKLCFSPKLKHKTDYIIDFPQH